MLAVCKRPRQEGSSACASCVCAHPECTRFSRRFTTTALSASFWCISHCPATWDDGRDAVSFRGADGESYGLLATWSEAARAAALRAPVMARIGLPSVEHFNALVAHFCAPGERIAGVHMAALFMAKTLDRASFVHRHREKGHAVGGQRCQLVAARGRRGGQPRRLSVAADSRSA